MPRVLLRQLCDPKLGRQGAVSTNHAIYNIHFSDMKTLIMATNRLKTGKDHYNLLCCLERVILMGNPYRPQQTFTMLQPWSSQDPHRSSSYGGSRRTTACDNLWATETSLGITLFDDREELKKSVWFAK